MSVAKDLQADEALRQQDDRLVRMIGEVRDYAIFMLDVRGHIVSWNKGAERMKLYRRDEIIGKHFSIFYGEEDRRIGHPEEELEQAVEKGSYSEEGWRYRKDGTRFWASVVITALKDEHSRLYGFGKVTRDLTERRKAEEDGRRLAEARAAREITDRLQSATAAFAVATTSADVTQTVFERVLPALDADTGSLAVLSPDGRSLELTWAHGYEEATLKPFRVMPLDAEMPITRAVRDQQPAMFDSKEAIAKAWPSIVRDDLFAFATLPLIAGGRCFGALGLTYRRPKQFDGTWRSLALAFADQCALALDRAMLFEREGDAKRRAEFLSEATSVLSSSLDHGRVLSELARLIVPRLGDWCSIELSEANGERARPAALAHVDPAKIALAREFREKYPPKPGPAGGLFHVFKTGKAELYADIPDAALVASASDPEQLRLLREIGMRSGICVPLNAHGRTLGAISLVWAESKRRYTMVDVEFVQDLCNRAALAFENAKLYEDVRHAVTVRDDFLSVAGHEMRTPLAALLLQLQTSLFSLKREPAIEQGKIQGRLERSIEHVTRLDELVDRLLDVTRLTSSGLRLEPEALDLTTVLETVTKRFTEEAERNASPLQLRSTGPLPGQFDRLRLEQTFGNLVSNALKYGRGHPIEIEAKREGDEAVIRFTDHGIGIAPEDQQRIFDRFERAVSDKNYGGLGLGLWIARQAIEASGGRLSVASELGKGSVFTVTLPLTA